MSTKQQKYTKKWYVVQKKVVLSYTLWYSQKNFVSLHYCFEQYHTDSIAMKTSIRFYKDHEVRAVWDEENAKWWFSANDTLDGRSKKKAYTLIESNLVADF